MPGRAIVISLHLHVVTRKACMSRTSADAWLCRCAAAHPLPVLHAYGMECAVLVSTQSYATECNILHGVHQASLAARVCCWLLHANYRQPAYR
jgi:hypothetical protein